MEGHESRSTKKKKTFSLSEKQKNIRKIEIPKAFVKQNHAFASQDEAMIQNVKENSKITTNLGVVKRSSTLGDNFIDKQEEASREARPRATKRMSSTIRRIQEKIKKEQLKDMAGGLSKEGQAQDYYTKALNAVAVVRNARRQRSKSRTKQGKMKCDQLQRPYRRWLGVSTCVASDTRFIVGPNRADDEVPDKEDECGNDNKTDDRISKSCLGSVKNSFRVDPQICPENLDLTEEFGNDNPCGDKVPSNTASLPSTSQSKSSEHQTHNDNDNDSISSLEQSSSSNLRNETRRTKLRRKLLRFRDSVSSPPPEIRGINGEYGQDKEEFISYNMRDETSTKTNGVELVAKRSVSETELLSSGSDSFSQSDATQTNIDLLTKAEVYRASPLPFKFSLLLLPNDIGTVESGNGSSNNKTDTDLEHDDSKASGNGTTEQEIFLSKLDFTPQHCDAGAATAETTNQKVCESSDEGNLLAAGVSPHSEKKETEGVKRIQNKNCQSELIIHLHKEGTETNSEISQSFRNSEDSGLSPDEIFSKKSQCVEGGDVCPQDSVMEECCQSEAFSLLESDITGRDNVLQEIQESKEEGQNEMYEMTPEFVGEEIKQSDTDLFSHSSKDESGLSELFPQSDRSRKEYVAAHQGQAPNVENFSQGVEDVEDDCTDDCVPSTSDEKSRSESAKQSETGGSSKDYIVPKSGLSSKDDRSPKTSEVLSRAREDEPEIENETVPSSGAALAVKVSKSPSKPRDNAKPHVQSATKRDQASLTLPLPDKISTMDKSRSDARNSDQGGLAGDVVNRAKFVFFPPIPPEPPVTPKQGTRFDAITVAKQVNGTSNRSGGVGGGATSSNLQQCQGETTTTTRPTNSLRNEMRTFRDRQLFEARAPRTHTLRRLRQKFKKLQKKKEYIDVLAIKDSEGTLPGQLPFKKGQTIKQLDTGLRDVDGMFYGYYRAGRLRRKVWGIYPSTHVSLFFDSEEEDNEAFYGSRGSRTAGKTGVAICSSGGVAAGANAGGSSFSGDKNEQKIDDKQGVQKNRKL